MCVIRGVGRDSRKKPEASMRLSLRTSIPHHFHFHSLRTDYGMHDCFLCTYSRSHKSRLQICSAAKCSRGQFWRFVHLSVFVSLCSYLSVWLPVYLYVSLVPIRVSVQPYHPCVTRTILFFSTQVLSRQLECLSLWEQHQLSSLLYVHHCFTIEIYSTIFVCVHAGKSVFWLFYCNIHLGL